MSLLTEGRERKKEPKFQKQIFIFHTDRVCYFFMSLSFLWGWTVACSEYRQSTRVNIPPR